MYPSSNQDKELFLDILTKEEREALLSKKLEAMKKKNQLLKQRHEEVEADKRIAAEQHASKLKSPGQQDAPRGKDTRFPYSDERKHHQADDRKAHFSDEHGDRKAHFADERKGGRLAEEVGSHAPEERRSKSAGRGKQLAKFSQKELKAQEIDIVVVNKDALNDSFKDEGRRGKYHGKENKRDSWNEDKRSSWHEDRRTPKNEKRGGNRFDNRQDHRRDDDRRDNRQDHRRDDDRRDNRPDHRRGDDRRDNRQDHRPDDDRRDERRENTRRNNYTAMKRSPTQPTQKTGHFHPYERKEDDDPNGPPPDPSYNFLSDRTREGPAHHQNKDQSRRHPQNFGGTDFDRVKDRMKYDQRSPHDSRYKQQPKSKMEMAVQMTGKERRQYTEWRTERDRVDQERMDRQKGQSGEWRRAWDADKNDNYEEPPSPSRTEPAKRPAGRIGSGRFAHSDVDDRVKSESTSNKAGVTPPQPQEVQRKPSGRGRGRGRGRGISTENKEPRPPRQRSLSDETRKVERQQDLLVIKVDNSPDKNSGVEVSYSEDYDTLRKKNKKKRSTASSAVQTPDDESWHSETNSHPDDSHDEKTSSGHSRDKYKDGDVVVDNDDSWEDATEDSSDFYGTTGESEDGQPHEDHGLKVDCSLNPDAPEFTPVSPDMMKTPPGVKKVEDWANTSLSPRSDPLSPTYQIPNLLQKYKTSPKEEKIEETNESQKEADRTENTERIERRETDDVMAVSKETLHDSADEEDPDTETYGRRGSSASVEGNELDEEVDDADDNDDEKYDDEKNDDEKYDDEKNDDEKYDSEKNDDEKIDDENDDEFVAANGDITPSEALSNGGVNEDTSPHGDAEDQTGQDGEPEDGDGESAKAHREEISGASESAKAHREEISGASDESAPDVADEKTSTTGETAEVSVPEPTEGAAAVTSTSEQMVNESSSADNQSKTETDGTSKDDQSELETDGCDNDEAQTKTAFETVKYVHSNEDESQKNDENISS